MNQITKVSEITYRDIADYIRLDELGTDEINTLETFLGIAKTYISKYTGRTIEELDDAKDIIIAVMVLCQDMYDNRTLYVNNGATNKVVDSILSLYSVNLL